MLLMRKLSMLVVAVVSLLALNVSSASAQVEVFDEETEEHCSEVTIVAHHVEGGCHVQYQSDEHIPLVVYTSTPMLGTTCNWHFDAQIGEDGSGYVTEAELSTEPEESEPPCILEPCDEVTHEMVPWPIQMSQSAGSTTMEIDVCLRSVSSGEGGPSFDCELHFSMTQGADHNHDIGNHREYFCEVSPFPPFAVSFQGVHLVNEVDAEEGTEDIYFTESEPDPTTLEVLDEPSNEHCGPVLLDDHTVEGGCHVEYESEEHLSMVLHTPNPVVVSICEWHFEARVSEGGSGYVTEAVLHGEFPPTNPGCSRVPCDEATEMIPWPLQITEVGPDDERVEMEFCTQPASGGADSWCVLHLPLLHVGSHEYDFGSHAEYFCEVSPGLPPVSFRDVRFVEEPGDPDTEHFEVVH